MPDRSRAPMRCDAIHRLRGYKQLHACWRRARRRRRRRAATAAPPQIPTDNQSTSADVLLSRRRKLIIRNILTHSMQAPTCQCFCSPTYPADLLPFSNVLGDGMVLQRAPQQAVIWGFAEPGSIIVQRWVKHPSCVNTISTVSACKVAANRS